MKEMDVENLSEEELDDALKEAEQEEPGTSEGDKDESADVKDSEELGQEEKEPEQEEENADNEEEAGEEKKDPLKETQRAFHKGRRELKDAQLKITELEEKIKLLQSGNSEFKELSQEKLEELKYDDTDKYLEYLEKKRQHDADRAETERKQAETSAEIQTQRQMLNTFEFIQESVGIDFSEVKNPLDIESYPPDIANQIQEYAKSEEFRKLEAFVRENFKPGKDGVFTAQQLRAANKAVNFDILAAKERAKAANTTVEKIKKAANGTSKLNGSPRDDKATDRKPIESLTQEDIELMGENELNSYLEEVDL